MNASALRLLIVEDSEQDARLMVRELERHGLQVRHLRVADRPALEQALAGEPWDAALLDHNLPGFSGQEALRLIRERDPDIPLIVISGTIGEEQAVECMKAGAHDYLMKGNLLRLGPALERELREAALRREKRAETRQAEDRFRTLFEGASDAMFIYDFEGQLLEVNLEACSRMGYTREQLLHRNLRQLETPQFAAMLPARLQETTRKGFALYETAQLGRDGRVVPAEVSARIIELQGRPVIFSTARDISERRRAEEERARLQSMVQQAQQLEAIGQLAGGVAHDFGNILTAILGYSEILLKKLEPGPNLEFVRQIQAACQRATALTQGLLALGRKQPFAPRPLELNSWLGARQDFFRRLLREDLELELRPAAVPLPLSADEAQLEQVLLNLLTNARDAMPDGGTITLSTSRQAHLACITVSDTGTGMDEPTRARMFEPFFTTKPRGKGTGLGLPVVWGIVQQHRGSIEVHSEPDRGTTFRILLPLNQAVPEPARSSEEQALPGGHETVLLAEDDEALRVLLSAALRQAGYTVLAAADGREALRLFAAEQARIDAAILDVIAPQATAGTVFREIRFVRPKLPILLISGYMIQSERQKPEGEAEPRLLRKPFTTAELLRRLREVLDT